MEPGFFNQKKTWCTNCFLSGTVIDKLIAPVPIALAALKKLRLLDFFIIIKYRKDSLNLFDGDRFSQISGLIHVAPAHDSDVVREQLQWNRG